MEVWQIILLVIGIVLFLIISGAIFSIVFTNKIAETLYNKQWARNENAKFERGCSDTSVDYHLDMYNQGMEYRQLVKEYISDVKINSLGDDLYGEYYDFGFKKALIVMPGRTETVYYGAFYVEAFRKGGYNVLCIDPRAHGLSGGDKITLGKDESVDLINWSIFLHDEKGIESICLYGLCGGATASCFALVNKDCPKYINSFIADGMFYSFFRVYKRHIQYEKKPVYPVILEIMHKIKKRNGVNPYKAAPHKLIKNITVPVLVLSGENDIFALSNEAEKMLLSCPSKDKTFALIKSARHSHLRYDNKNDYDEAVAKFLGNH